MRTSPRFDQGCIPHDSVCKGDSASGGKASITVASVREEWLRREAVHKAPARDRKANEKINVLDDANVTVAVNGEQRVPPEQRTPDLEKTSRTKNRTQPSRKRSIVKLRKKQRPFDPPCLRPLVQTLPG